MSKKEKKIEIQIADGQVEVKGQSYDGYLLSIGKKEIGQIAELGEEQFAVVNKGAVSTIFKKLEQAIGNVIENYNLSH